MRVTVIFWAIVPPGLKAGNQPVAIEVDRASSSSVLLPVQ